MTKRLPVTVPYMRFRDGQMVDERDMDFEQTNKLQTQAAITNNFFGSGLLLYSPTRRTLFDSDNLTAVQQSLVASNDFDGRGIQPHAQPTDTELGQQLEVTFTGINPTLRKSAKVCIIGLDFEQNTQYEIFEFHKSEIQVGKKHFTHIITLMFNDFKGNKNCSIPLGGSIVIKEAQPMQLSRDAITASQNLEPNLFFRDFKVVDQSLGPNPSTTLNLTIQAALGSSYTVDSLHINTNWLNKKYLSVGDIATRYGQKFKAKVSNIQKATLLLGVQRDLTVPAADYFDWSGDIIVSVHALQTSIACPTDTIPDNAIDFQPDPTPLAQIVITQATLAAQGITLTDTVQPVNFVFTNTRIGGYTNTGITSNNYYIVMIQRAGNTATGTLFTETGSNFTDNSTFSEFNGSTWTDDPNQDLWFEIYSDSLKVADGMGYDAGSSISIDKTEVETNTGVTIDYSEDGIGFANNGQDVLNHVVAQSVNELITVVQDDRTGSPVYSQQTTDAEISTVTTTQLSTLTQTEEPIILGCAYDINNKSSELLTGSQQYIGLTSGNVFCLVDPPAELKLYNLVGGKFIANTGNVSALKYLIYRTELCVDGYGDLDGDGYVSANDVLRANALVGEDITSPITQAKVVAGTIGMLELIRSDVDGDGIISASDVDAINGIYTKDPTTVLPFGATFERLCIYVENLDGRNDGYHSCNDGYARIYNPQPTSVYYTSLSASELLWYGYPVPVNIPGNEPALTTVPFVAVPYSIAIEPSWREQFLKAHYTGRLLPCTFTDLTSTTVYDCADAVAFSCDDLEKNYSCNGGRNDWFVPDNLIMGNGQLLGTDGEHHAVDLETNNIILTLPDTAIINKSLDIFTVFVAEESGSNGFTSYGYPAMKFADCSYVQSNGLTKDQIRFSASIASLNTMTDGYSIDDGYGIIVDELVGLYMNQSTGVLTITSTNIGSDLTSPSENCRLLIQVMIKKAGWKNREIIVTPDELSNLLGV